MLCIQDETPSSSDGSVQSEEEKFFEEVIASSVEVSSEESDEFQVQDFRNQNNDEIYEEVRNEGEEYEFHIHNLNNEPLGSDGSNTDNRKHYSCENRIMFDKSGFTIRDVVAMIRGLAIRYCLTLEARLAVINFSKLCAGPEFDSINLSIYVISNIFYAPDDRITFCFYCPSCKKILDCRYKKKGTNPEGLCDKCGTKCNLSVTKGNFF